MSDLNCAGIRVAFGRRQVLDGIGLTLGAGAVTAIVGANGAGKSTLLECLAGLREADAGQVSLDGSQLASMPPRGRARRIAFLPQTPEIAWPVDARTLIGLGRVPHAGATGATTADNDAIDRAIDATGVGPFANRIVTSLSGGERARVLIVRALAGEPDWLIADEPMTGLDPAHQLDVAELLRSMAGRGTGILVTLHDLGLAMRLADRLVVLAEGRVIADGAPGDALTPDILLRAYGIEVVLGEGAGGPLVDVIRRAD